MEKSSPIFLSAYLFKRFYSDEKIYWHYLSIFLTVSYSILFFEDFTIFIYFIWQNIYVHLLGTVCCFDSYINQEMLSSGWFIHPLPYTFRFQMEERIFECRMLSYWKHPEGHLLATSWRHVMNVIEWTALLYGCALSCPPFPWLHQKGTIALILHIR